jgi:aminoglycoside/choline kinase family phosphotransferase
MSLPGSIGVTMAKRDNELAAFLDAAGWSRQAARPLAGDASNRRYLRLGPEPGQPAAVLMDAPPSTGEDVRPFVAVTHWLREHGFSAPAIAAADTARGFLTPAGPNAGTGGGTLRCRGRSAGGIGIDPGAG